MDENACDTEGGDILIENAVCESPFPGLGGVCCDQGPPCAFECVGFWACGDGLERDGFCSGGGFGQVCCETGLTPCDAPDACIPSNQCPEERLVEDAACGTGEVCCEPV